MPLVTCSFGRSTKKTFKKSSNKLQEAEDFGTEQLSIPQFSAKTLQNMFTSDLYLVPTTTAIDSKGKKVGSDFKLDIRLLEDAPLVKNVYVSKALAQLWSNTSLEPLCKLVSTVKKSVGLVSLPPFKTIFLVNEDEFKLFKFEKSSFTISHESKAVYGCVVPNDFCKGRFQSLGKIVVKSIYKEKKCGRGMMQHFSRTPLLNQNISKDLSVYGDCDLISKTKSNVVFSGKHSSSPSTTTLEYNSEEESNSFNEAISYLKQEFFDTQVEQKKFANNIYNKSASSSTTFVSSQNSFNIVLPTPPPKAAVCTWS